LLPGYGAAGSEHNTLTPACKLLYAAGLSFYDCTTIAVDTGSNWLAGNMGNTVDSPEVQEQLGGAPPSPPLPPAPPDGNSASAPPAPPGANDWATEWAWTKYFVDQGARAVTADGWECDWRNRTDVWNAWAVANPDLIDQGNDTIASVIAEISTNLTSADCGFTPDERTIVDPKRWNEVRTRQPWAVCAPVACRLLTMYMPGCSAHLKSPLSPFFPCST
jgi:hypothetical protein